MTDKKVCTKCHGTGRIAGCDPHQAYDYQATCLDCSGTGFMDTKKIIYVARCDAIYMLDGWEESEGATAEHKLAEELGQEIFYEYEFAGG